MNTRDKIVANKEMLERELGCTIDIGRAYGTPHQRWNRIDILSMPNESFFEPSLPYSVTGTIRYNIGYYKIKDGEVFSSKQYLKDSAEPTEIWYRFHYFTLTGKVLSKTGYQAILEQAEMEAEVHKQDVMIARHLDDEDLKRIGEEPKKRPRFQGKDIRHLMYNIIREMICQ